MKKTVLSLLAVLALALSASAAEGRLLRFPTTNGSEVLLRKLGERKPLPGVPAPRDFSYPQQ